MEDRKPVNCSRGLKKMSMARLWLPEALAVFGGRLCQDASRNRFAILLSSHERDVGSHQPSA